MFLLLVCFRRLNNGCKLFVVFIEGSLLQSLSSSNDLGSEIQIIFFLKLLET